MYTLLSAEREYRNGNFAGWIAHYQRANVDLVTTLYINYVPETSYTWFTDAQIKDANGTVLAAFDAVNLLAAKDYWVTLHDDFPTMHSMEVSNVQLVVEEAQGIAENVNTAQFTEQVDSYIVDHINRLNESEEVSFLGNKYTQTAISDV